MSKIFISVDVMKKDETIDPKEADERRKVSKLQKNINFKAEDEIVKNNTTYIKQPRLHQTDDVILKFLKNSCMRKIDLNVW